MLTDDLIEDRLRLHFADSLDSSGDIVAQALRRHRRRKVGRAVAFTLPVALVAAVLGAVLATAGTPSGSAPPSFGSPSRGSDVLRLASYDFHLPKGYHLGSAAHAACQAIVTIALPRTTRTSAPSGATVSPYSTAMIASATTGTGGCVSMLLTPLFASTAETPLPYLRAGRAVTNSRVHLGRYTGWVTTQGAVTRWLETQGLVTVDGQLPDLQLSVAIPQGGGEYRLLDVGSQGIREATLVRIVSKGLS
jgi:hypothetical protein